MKSAISVTLLFIAFASSAQSPQPSTSVPVRDAATAVAIAEPALVKTHGQRQIDYEKPLTATLVDGVWIVHGSLCCPDRKGQRTCEVGKCKGRVPVLQLRQSDGEILSISSVRVPDAATALRIAERALDEVYGKRHIVDEKQLTATLENGVWIVYGSLCCFDRNGQRSCGAGICLGGVAELKLRQRDGKILSMSLSYRMAALGRLDFGLASKPLVD